MIMRYLPLGVFALWSIFCWRWYVCDIKQRCNDDDSGARAIERVEPPVAQQPAQPEAPAPAAPQANEQITVSKTVQSEVSESIEEAQVVAVEDHVLIYFPYGSTRREDDRTIDAYLTELSAALKNSGGSVSLIGHTDNIGDAASNKTMALQRAQHIKNTLVKKGVKASQIQCKSLGESKPQASNDHPKGRYLNRRVEVRLK